MHARGNFPVFVQPIFFGSAVMLHAPKMEAQEVQEAGLSVPAEPAVVWLAAFV